MLRAAPTRPRLTSRHGDDQTPARGRRARRTARPPPPIADPQAPGGWLAANTAGAGNYALELSGKEMQGFLGIR